MADKYWDHLKLKNGDSVKFVPPVPDGTRLGGVTADEKSQITANKDNIKNLVKDVQVAGTSVVSDGVANVPIASPYILGVVKPSAARGLTVRSSDGQMYLASPNASNIAKRTTDGYAGYGAINTSNLDIAVKAALTDSNRDQTYTDAEKANACGVIGATTNGWRYINTATLEAEDTRIYIAEDTDGNVIELNEAYVQITIPATAGNFSVYYAFSGEAWHGQTMLSSAVSTNGVSVHMCHAIKLTDNLSVIGITSGVNNAGNISSSLASNANFVKFGIDGFEFNTYSTSNKLPAGTTITMYGR